jgi:hypothetical protein
LRATSILQRDHIHAGTRNQTSQFFDLGHRCARRFEGTDPGVALDVETNVARSDWMSRGERRAANDILNVFRDDLFVADTVLHRADSAILVEGAGDLRDGATRVDGFGSDDAIIAARKFLGIAGGIQFRGEICRSRYSQTMIADGFDVIFPDVIGPDFGLAFLAEVRGEEAANRAATDDANSTKVHSKRKLEFFVETRLSASPQAVRQASPVSTMDFSRSRASLHR